MGDLGLVQETEVQVVILIYCTGTITVRLHEIMIKLLVEIFQILLCLLWGISTSRAIFSLGQLSQITFSREFKNILWLVLQRFNVEIFFYFEENPR